MGLEEITKPAAFGKHGGAWYRHGPNQLHLSVLRHRRRTTAGASATCATWWPNLAQAEKTMRAAGVEIVPDDGRLSSSVDAVLSRAIRAETLHLRTRR
jgi:hypothetical protein